MLRARYDKFKVEKEQAEFHTKFKQEEDLKAEQQNKRAYLLNKSKEYRQQQAEILARIKYELFVFSPRIKILILYTKLIFNSLKIFK